jgi:hypothetical protein
MSDPDAGLKAGVALGCFALVVAIKIGMFVGAIWLGVVVLRALGVLA